jgi:hypothetical protein
MADAPETPAQAKARRRHWLTLGEIIAVLALTISAAGLWDAHQDRVANRTRAADVKPAPAVPLALAARVADGGDRLTLTANRDRIIETQTFLFPAAIAAGSQDIVGDARIEAGWFADGLRRALTGKRVRGRLPVVIVTRYLDDGNPRTESAIYDVAYGWRTRLIGSDVPVLEGITLVSRGDKAIQARLDARWLRAHPVVAP